MNPKPQPVRSGAVDADRVVSILTDLTRASSALKLQTALAHGRQLLTELPSLKSPLRNFSNTLVAIQNGVADGELSQHAAKSQVHEANAELEAAVKKVLREIAESENTQDSETINLNLLKDSLTKFDLSKNDLQTRLTRSHFTVATCSVVAITVPPLSPSSLKNSGFTADSFDGYTILGKQIVAGLHSDYIREHVRSKAGPDGPARSADEVFQGFVDSVKKHYRQQNLMTLGRSISWWGASWVWLMPERQFKVLRSCTISGKSSLNLQIKSWGFPFDR